MRDFPIFTTEYGLSSLTLKEIPYKSIAYIHVREVQPGFFGEHMKECVSFCRMCGADAIFAAGNEDLEQYPLHMSVVEMRGTAQPDPAYVKCLFPVTEATVSQWRSIYNEKMRPVDNTATLETRDEKKILESGGAYFVHEDGTLLGIGWIEENKLLAVAASERGAGRAVMHTLMSLMEEEQIVLEVASTNTRAIRLYESLGFLKTCEISRWYNVTPAQSKQNADGE